MILMRGLTLLIVAMIATVTTPVVLAASGAGILNDRCSSCHNLTGPSAQTLAELWDRKGPDLFYAGDKYRQEWLESWLQDPQRIRPAGMFYGNHIKPGDEHDVVDESTLIRHPRLNAEEAGRVAQALMSLTAKSDLIVPGAYQEGTISLSMGEMMFDKFRGCLACHQIEPGYGGASGPEVYTVARRLQTDYLISFMRKPTAWEPKTFMPDRAVRAQDLQKFVHYFRALSEEKFDE